MPCRGRNNVTAKDDMLSFGAAAAPSQLQSEAQASAQPPAQARLSLFDLAEAAATLSTASRQALPAPTKSTPTKGKSPHGKDVQQSAPAVPKGQRSARKSKGGSSSPGAEGTPAAAAASAAAGAASSDGMQTRGRATRRPSVEKQPSGRSALPSKPTAKADKASKAQKHLPQPSTAHIAGAATQDVSPAVSKPEDIAQTLAPVPSTSDAAVVASKEVGPSTAAPAALPQPASNAGKLPHAETAFEVNGHTNYEPGHSLSFVKGQAGSSLQAALTAPPAVSAFQEAEGKPNKQKRRHKEGDGEGNGSQPASQAQAFTAAAGGKAIGQQDRPSQQTKSLGPSAGAALAGAAIPC